MVVGMCIWDGVVELSVWHCRSEKPGFRPWCRLDGV